MKSTIIVLALFLPARSLAQSSISPYSPTVSVQQLATSQKTERALEKGAALLRKHQMTASVSYFKKAIELDPGCYFAYYELALAHYGLGHVEDSEQEFQKSIELSRAQFAPSLFGLAMILYRRQDDLAAESLIEKGLVVAPSSGLGEYCLGLVQFSLGRIPEAQRSALEALRHDPSQADVYILLARIHERLNQPDAVVADVHAYLKQSGNHTLLAEAQSLLRRAQLSLNGPGPATDN